MSYSPRHLNFDSQAAIGPDRLHSIICNPISSSKERVNCRFTFYFPTIKETISTYKLLNGLILKLSSGVSCFNEILQAPIAHATQYMYSHSTVNILKRITAAVSPTILTRIYFNEYSRDVFG